MSTYLNTLYGSDAPGYVHTWRKTDKSTLSLPAKDLDIAQSYMETNATKADIFFEWGLQERPRPARKRGVLEGVVALPGIMCDLDVWSAEPGVHAKNDMLPRSTEEGLEFIVEELGLTPTYVRGSGNGAYPDFLFKELLVFRSVGVRTQCIQLSKRLQNGIIGLAGELKGWKFDNTSDLTRLTRMPGTKNHKTDPPKDVVLFPDGSGRRYDLSELEETAERLEERLRGIKKSQNQAAAKSRRRTKREKGKAPDFDAIVEECAWARSCVDQADRMPEPDWYGLAGIAARCEDGREKFHDISQADPRYSREETEKKLDQARDAAGPRLCRSIESDLGFSGCQMCPYRGRIRSPITLGHAQPEVLLLVRENILDVSTVTFIELKTGRRLSEASFNASYGHLIPNGLVSRALKVSELTVKVDRTDYRPGLPSGITTDEDGRPILNSWQPGDLEEREGHPQLILGHFDYLMTEQVLREHFLDALAFVVQQPAEKLKFSYLLSGKQGTGKSFIGVLLSRILGAANVRSIQSQELKSDFNAGLTNVQALIVEELMNFDQLDTANRLKVLQTEDQVRANEKFLPVMAARTPRFILALSNHDYPIKMEVSDRRWCVIRSAADKRDPPYYDALWRALDEEAGQFLRFLRQRDTSRFSPSAPPPMSEAKAEIIDASTPLVTQAVVMMIREAEAPFDGDLLVLEDLRLNLRYRVGRHVSDHEMRVAMKAVGAEEIRQVQVKDLCGRRSRPRVWAHRSIEFWKQASADKIRDAYRSRFSSDPSPME